MTEQITGCRVCESAALEPCLSLGNMAYTGIFPKSPDEPVPWGPLNLVKCMGCGLVQLDRNFDPSVMYGQHYGYRSGLNKSMARHLEDIVREAERKVELGPGDIVLDIGSNDWTLLNSYENPGLARIGIDPIGCNPSVGHPERSTIINDFFSADAVTPYMNGKKASVVTSIAMFYDLPDPVQFARDVASILHKDGLWILEQSYLPQMVMSHSFDMICHEHFEYYTLSDIERIASCAELKIEDVHFDNTNGGSFRVALSHFEARIYSGSVLSKLVDIKDNISIENMKGWNSLAGLKWLESQVDTITAQLSTTLTDLKKRGKTILGYGASTKGNVLLQTCGISTNVLPAIAEVNEDKFGRVTPGTYIPIISEAEARAMKPDYFMVLPWHFRDNIIQREKEFLSSGGRLIFPLPNLEIVGEQ